MPTVEENAETWRHYDWEIRGDEWSSAWGNANTQWWFTIFPRISRFLPAAHVLEIAPGFGRWTAYLKDLAGTLEIVDLEPRCIEACRERFRRATHIRYFVNDGRSLAAIADGSIDFAFSYDSLVHVEADVIEAYVVQLAQKLRPGGVAFLHHSNLGVFRTASGALEIENPHWRATSVTAELVANAAQEAGLHPLSQEIVNWGTEHLTDCFSTLCRPDRVPLQALQRVENPAFMDEATRLRQHVDALSQERGTHRQELERRLTEAIERGEALQTRIEAFDERIEALNADVARLAPMEAQAANLTALLGERDETIARLEGDVANLDAVRVAAESERDRLQGQLNQIFGNRLFRGLARLRMIDAGR